METLLETAMIAGAGIIASTAAAQSNETAPQNAALWKGFYVGAQGAYHHGEKIDDGGCAGLCARDHKVKEMYVAVQAGYDIQGGRPSNGRRDGVARRNAGQEPGPALPDHRR